MENKVLFSTRALLLLMIRLSTQLYSAEKIIVAGPVWNDFANRDGSGVYLDILKRIYRQHDYVVNFENIPFKRATKWLEQGEVDVQLGVYSKCHLDKFYEIYEVITPTTPLGVEQTVAVYKKIQP